MDRSAPGTSGGPSAPPPPPGGASGRGTSWNCPECGTPFPHEARFAQFIVCPACRSSVVIDEKAARVSGTMATLAPPTGPLSLGAIGTIGRTPFRVLGRVRYGYEAGYWDEWYLLLDEERAAWVSEDGGEFALETARTLPTGRIHHEDIRPGQRLRFGKVEYHVDEVGVAICEGGEGQLPFPIVPDERIPFLDLTSDESFATIEFDGDTVRLFQGEKIDPRTLHVTVGGGNSDTLATERAGDSERRERIAKQAGRQAAIDCHSCGASLGVPEPGAPHVTCEYCATEIDLGLERAPCPECDRTVPIQTGSGGAAPGRVFLTCQGCRAQFQWEPNGNTVMLQALASGKKPRIPFKLGQRARFEGETFTLIGHLRTEERDDGDVYRTDEFLLFAPGAGYRWLTLEDGHWTFGRSVNDRPKVSQSAGRKTRFACRGQKWRVFETGRSEVTWVDGELPWIATVGDRLRYLDAISPPYLLSGEFTKSEAEWSLARYTTREEVAQAFSIDPKKLPRPRGVAPAQPYPDRPTLRASAWVMLAFFVVQVVLLIWAAGQGKTVETYAFRHVDYSTEVITAPFTVRESDTLCDLVIETPTLDDQWVYLDFLVIDGEEGVIHEFSDQLSFYSGYDGGEKWSEGSRRSKVGFQIADPGEYRMVIAGESGKRERPESFGPDVRLTVREGIVLKRWFILLAIVTGSWACGVWLHRAIFEGRRWKSFEED